MVQTTELAQLEDDLLIEDPLGQDEAEDAILYTTRRALSRVAFVAAETAARFEREGVEHDPMAWMLSPRRMFDGDAALDACLDRPSFLRAVLLHGLALGLDAEPHELDDLVEDDDLADFDSDQEDALFYDSAGYQAFDVDVAYVVDRRSKPLTEVRQHIERVVGPPVVNHLNAGVPENFDASWRRSDPVDDRTHVTTVPRKGPVVSKTA